MGSEVLEYSKRISHSLRTQLAVAIGLVEDLLAAEELTERDVLDAQEALKKAVVLVDELESLEKSLS